jgi:hypothetical protein
MSYDDMEKQIHVLNSSRPLIVRVPIDLFELLKTSGVLTQIDMTVSILLIKLLREQGWLKEEKKV